MPSGTVKSFNGQRGFGFIGPDAGDNDVFVHIAGLKRSNVDHLREGEKVTFDVVDNRGKPVADIWGCDDGALKAPRPYR
jgi:cold shock protein